MPQMQDFSACCSVSSLALLFLKATAQRGSKLLTPDECKINHNFTSETAASSMQVMTYCIELRIGSLGSGYTSL
jgi:hypothetical protein